MPSICSRYVRCDPEECSINENFLLPSFYISFNHENIVVLIRVRRNESILNTLQAISRVHLNGASVAQDVLLIREEREGKKTERIN